MKINNGELKINLEDGLDDEIEIIVACCGGCLNPLFKYLSSKVNAFNKKNIYPEMRQNYKEFKPTRLNGLTF